jgi:nucleoid DNA-binding protein
MPVKKVPVKKTAPKKKIAPTPVVKKLSAVKEPYKQTQIINHIAETTDLGKKEIKHILETIKDLIGAHICKKGAKEFSFLSLFKITVLKKPATKARKGVNPFTGQEITIAAKPARNVVKIRPLKKLKEMIEN